MNFRMKTTAETTTTLRSISTKRRYGRLPGQGSGMSLRKGGEGTGRLMEYSSGYAAETVGASSGPCRKSFETKSSGRRELNSIFLLPKQVYYRHTPARYLHRILPRIPFRVNVQLKLPQG